MLSSTHSSAPLPRIAVVVGSNRRDSINRKLAQALVRLGAGKFEAAFAPMFNQDIESNCRLKWCDSRTSWRAPTACSSSRRNTTAPFPPLSRTLSIGAHAPGARTHGSGKPAFITGTSPGAIGSALAQQHLRSVMTGLGMILLGGEAYVTFKPDLINEHGNIGDDNTKKFLADFVDRFAGLVTALAPARQASAA